MIEAFNDYNNKMQKLANIHEAEAYHLKRVAEACQEVSDECLNVADSIRKYIDGVAE